MDPLQRYDNYDFLRRFRFSKASFVQLDQLIFGKSAGRRGLGPWIPLRLKMLIAIQMYATNCFFLVCADVAEFKCRTLLFHVV